MRLFEKVYLHDLTKDIIKELPRISKECKPYIKEITKGGKFNPFYSGRKYRGYMFKGRVRTDRKPRDMFPELHEDLDDVFQKKFGWPVRSSGMFVTGNIASSYEYGHEYMIFPIGNFKYIWSPKINDLYMHLKYKGDVPKNENTLFTKAVSIVTDRTKDKDISPSEIRRMMEVEYELLLDEIVDSYTQKDLLRAIEYGHEIIITCKEYYAITEAENMYVKDYFRTFGTKIPTEKMIDEWLHQFIGRGLHEA
jgi:hypothetical protein